MMAWGKSALLCAAAFSTLCYSKKPLHIVFILADDLGWNDVGFHGSRQIPTPNIDSFARDGIVLNNYYTLQLCTPSRGSLFTGKYASRIGLQHSVVIADEPWGLPLEEKILPQYLKELGYATHGVGKWHLGFFKEPYLPTKRGFDSFFGFWTGYIDYFYHTHQEGKLSGLEFHDGENPAWEYEGIYSTDIYTAKAKWIIEHHNSSQPLFLFLSHQAVHTGNPSRPLQATPKDTKFFTSIKDADRKIYAGMTWSLDNSVGEIFQSLESSGILNDTLVIFSSDNGAAVEGMNYGSSGSNWPLRGAKYMLWEGGIRAVAWIWSRELRNHRRVDNSLFHISDWLPTLLDAAGGDYKALRNIDGVNQWPVIARNRSTFRREMLLNIDPLSQMEGIRKGPYKLIRGTYKNGIYDGWLDEEGDFDEDRKRSSKTKFTDEELEAYENNYRQALCNSKAAKLLLRHFKVDVCASENFSLTTKCMLNTALPTFTTCNSAQEACLFDLENDPCEFFNLAPGLPQVVDELEALLQLHKKRTVWPLNRPPDRAADPRLSGGVWSPWKR